MKGLGVYKQYDEREECIRMSETWAVSMHTGGVRVNDARGVGVQNCRDGWWQNKKTEKKKKVVEVW